MKTNEQIAIEALQACLDATRQLSEIVEKVLIQIKHGPQKGKNTQEKAAFVKLSGSGNRTTDKEEEQYPECREK